MVPSVATRTMLLVVVGLLFTTTELVSGQEAAATPAPAPAIPDTSCTEDTACQNNNVEVMEIGGRSCNEVDSCSSNTGNKLSVGLGACNSAKSISSSQWVGPQGGSGTCSYNSGDVIIGNLGCTGPGSCAYNAQKVQAGQRACSGEVTCSNNNAQMDANDEGCKGDGSCSQNGPSENDAVQPTDKMIVRVQNGACGGEGSCRLGKGNALLLGGCGGTESCQEWVVDYATGADAVNIGTTSFTVQGGSCTGDNSCQKLSGTAFTIMDNSCRGANSCQNIAAASGSAITIGTNACTEDNSCQDCSADIPDGACKCDGSACKSDSGGTSSSGSSGGGGSTGSNSSGGASEPSSAIYFGQRFASFLVLLVGFWGI